MRVRAAPVADDHHADVAALRRRLGDEAAAAEALVVGMGGDDDEAGRGDRVEIGDGQRRGGGEKGGGLHRSISKLLSEQSLLDRVVKRNNLNAGEIPMRDAPPVQSDREIGNIVTFYYTV